MTQIADQIITLDNDEQGNVTKTFLFLWMDGDCDSDGGPFMVAMMIGEDDKGKDTSHALANHFSKWLDDYMVH